MKLLFDQNISFRLTNRLRDILPDCKQVKEVNLGNSNDVKIWNFAKENGYTIVTFDADFRDLSLVRGIPPKVIWIRTRNQTTSHIEILIRNKITSIKDFLEDPDFNEIGCLELDG